MEIAPKQMPALVLESASESAITVADLPAEIVESILEFIPTSYMILTGRVCRLWRELSTRRNTLSPVLDWLERGDTRITAHTLGCGEPLLIVCLNEMMQICCTRKKVLYHEAVGTSMYPRKRAAYAFMQSGAPAPLNLFDSSMIIAALLRAAIIHGNLPLIKYMFIEFSSEIEELPINNSDVSVRSCNPNVLAFLLTTVHNTIGEIDDCYKQIFMLPEEHIVPMFSCLVGHTCPFNYDVTDHLIHNGLFDIMRASPVIWEERKEFLFSIPDTVSDFDLDWFLQAAKLDPVNVFAMMMSEQNLSLYDRMFDHLGWSYEDRMYKLLESVYAGTEADFNLLVKMTRSNNFDVEFLHNMSDMNGLDPWTLEVIMVSYPYGFTPSWSNIETLFEGGSIVFDWGFQHGFREIFESDKPRFISLINDVNFDYMQTCLEAKQFTLVVE